MMDASPWLCHVCESKGKGESQSCSLCYMTTCAEHLRKVSMFNPETGLYEILPICLDCTIKGVIS